ncbi:MAG: efflux RND transporter permease subunit [Candidatus Margulisbacteria bacterium]|nr:efflux RND transporter permease subunit [Candidatus Margulisiibacteriota bacterium]
MLNALIRYSLKNRFLILLIAIVMMAYGFWVGAHLPVDVFPDLNRPTVTILTEAHGLAPEEVETLVSLPIESVMNGVPGATRIRSSSGIGISIVHVEFAWGTDIYRNRQFVAERIQLLGDRLPEGMRPMMGPITSIMGEIQFIGLSAPDNSVSPMELRTLADWAIRPRLMGISGISQVVVMGGEVKQYRILVSSDLLQKKGISMEDCKQTLSKMSNNTTGGFIDIHDQEYLIRPLGRVTSLEEIENSVVGIHLGKPVLVKDVAKVDIGAKTKRGEASINGHHSVVMTIQKQPNANTIELTKQIEKTLKEMERTLPKGVILKADLFKQSRFIEAANNNVIEALKDGAIIIAIIVFIFLLNVRSTMITLVTIPISLLLSVIVFKMFNLTINTMTLGGFAIAIGELVDDAIVDMENVFRRLRENQANGSPKGRLRVIYEASSEVRNSIIFSTITVILVFLPLFFLGGIEGRLFKPLGLAYIISLVASLIVSLTVTPVLCSFLLKGTKLLRKESDNRVVIFLKSWQKRILSTTLDHPYKIMMGCLILVVLSLCLIPQMGKNFLPPFNEGTATIGVAARPGISLSASDKLGIAIEKAILAVPEVKSTIRRTGRAEMDEHAEGVHWSEIDVDFKEGGRPREIVLKEIRENVEKCGNVYVNIGQPISHRLDHLLSGVRAQIAVKIFGTELSELRRLGVEIEDILKDIPGIVDLTLEPSIPIPQLKISIDREAVAQLGISPGEVVQDLEGYLNGETVAQFIEKQQLYDIVMRLDDDSRRNPDAIGNVLVKTMPNGYTIQVKDIADTYESSGPSMINRENLQRRIVISANTHGRDLGSVVEEIEKRLDEKMKIPQGYYISLEGQFKSQQQATKLILIFGILSLLAIMGLLYMQFRSWVLMLQIMLNIPLALIGSIVAIYITERQFSVATLIAFITLCGIASRNGIMMISHYIHLVQHEGETFTKEFVFRGAQERLVPVLMTSFTAALALVPLLLSKGEPGKEILYPVAVVIVGGLLSSTLLDIIVTPTLFYKFGRKAIENLSKTSKNSKQQEGDWK